MVIQEQNPFSPQNPKLIQTSFKSPYALRIALMWSRYREIIIPLLSDPPGISHNIQSYLKSIEEIHNQDAYHSLSIEGYQVSIELIQKVESGEWNPDQFAKDVN